MLITYSCDGEVLVTTPELERKTVREYFEEGGRDIHDYDREIHKDTVAVRTRAAVWS